MLKKFKIGKNMPDTPKLQSVQSVVARQEKDLGITL